MAALWLVASLSYVVGSIPFGWLLAKGLRGVDLRTLGSGNIGATNASRVLGKFWGTVVLLLDAAKGAVPVLLLPRLMTADVSIESHLPVVAGVGAILGHMFPVWLKFRGGKGVATALGVIACLAPWGTLAAFVTFAICFAATRIVSLGSILAAVVFAVFQAIWLGAEAWQGPSWSLAAFSLLIPALVIYRHRANIARLWVGKEPSLVAGRGDQPT
ncbi:MAG: glycerol-3-phosphate 1-O-acyltransferase PlsY [Planctomycetaceae bacterium]|nr:glycerol-3-phosphate 1-O-acyltransferase PlsY [Planctomycetaceae bacterium]